MGRTGRAGKRRRFQEMHMRVFVTGASGWVGSAATRELVGAGHSVIGLARSDAGMQRVRDAGGEPLSGDIGDLGALRRAVGEADAVIHTAFNHDFSKFVESCANDARVVAALAEAAGRDKPVLITSGTALVNPGQLARETDVSTLTAQQIPRVATETAARDAARAGACVGLMRLPPTVHGEGDKGFVPMLVKLARDKGVSAYIGEGANRWPAAHRFDVGRAYRLAVEKVARGAAFHLVAEEGVPMREIAEAIGGGLGVPVVSIRPEEAAAHFGFLAHFVALDCPASSAWTRETLGWAPGERTLREDLAQRYYFAS
jgi:nucleoside-diphosphate-sugar epimerase